MHSKRILAPFLTAASALCLMAQPLLADTFGLFEYTDNGTSITITGYTGSGGVVAIPDTIIGKPVTSIGDYAFNQNYWLTHITLPSGVTTIGQHAFRNCSRLTSIVIPDSVTSIGEYAFLSCHGLTNVTLSANLTIILAFAFHNCPELASITLPDNVTYIGRGAFSSTKLASIILPNSVTTIEAEAFAGTKLASITIPANVTTIGTCAFYCRNLASISVDTANAAYAVVDGVLFDKNLTTLIQCPPLGKTGFYSIPDSATTIGPSAFSLCSELTGITIPASVTNIEQEAFNTCSNLANITIPDSVTYIPYGAFANCPKLSSITIPGSVTTIAQYAFGQSSHKNLVFLGDAPSMTYDPYFSATVYYFNDKTGFTSPTWHNYPTVNMGDSTPVKNWLIAKGLPYNADLKTDSNGDGVNLLMAYALNLDPIKNLSGGMPRAVVAGSQMRLQFYAGAEGVSYSVESSTDLKNWSAAGVEVTTPDSLTKESTATVNMTGPRQFMRLVVSSP